MFETVCKKCGTHNDASATFCGSCGAFLEWEGERVSTDEPVGTPVIGSPDGPPAAAPPPPTTWATPPPPPLGPTPEATGGGPETPTPFPDGGRQPVAMQPALPAPPRPTPQTQLRAPTRRPNPGDLICGQCGEGNDPHRRFCRRCGAILTGAAPALRRSWWQRFWHRRPATPAGSDSAAGADATGGSGGPAGARRGGSRTKAPKAPKLATPPGHRPPSIGTGGSGLKSSRRPGKGLILVAVVAVVAVFLIVPGLRKHVTSEGTRVRKVFHPHYTEIPVSAVTAAPANSCTAPSIEGNNTVYWYSQATGSTPQVLLVTFAPSFTGDLDKIGVTPIAPGSAGTPSAAASPAPSQLQITGSSPVTPAALTLADPPKFQSFTLKATAPRSLQIRLAASDPTTSTACAETAFIFYEKD
jgi:ribosomal protein L40E